MLVAQLPDTTVTMDAGHYRWHYVTLHPSSGHVCFKWVRGRFDARTAVRVRPIDLSGT
jgi:hypothetical protein